MDSAFKTAPYSGYTTDQLRQMASRPSGSAREIWAEIERREAVAAGDMSKATPGERLRFVKTEQAQ